MEEKEATVLESVGVLFGKAETLEASMPVVPYDQSVGLVGNPDSRELNVTEIPPLTLGKHTKLNKAETWTNPADYEEGTHNFKGEGITNYISFTRRRRSISLIDVQQKEEEEKPFSVRQRTHPPHPRRHRPERRRTILSGLNLLLPRKNLEYENDSDVITKVRGNDDVEQVSCETTSEYINDHGISLINMARTSNNDDIMNERICSEPTNNSKNNGNCVTLVRTSSGADSTVENLIDSGSLKGGSSEILDTDKTLLVSRDDDSATVDYLDSVETRTAHSPCTLGSVSSSSTPPLPRCSPPDQSLLGQGSVVILGPIRKHCSLHGKSDKDVTNFADQLTSVLSTAAIDSANDSNSDDSNTSSKFSSSVMQQEPHPVGWSKSQDEMDLSSLSSLSIRGSTTSLFCRLFDISNKESQSLRNQPDSMNNTDTRLSQSELCLLQLSGTTRIKSRDRRNYTVGRSSRKTYLSADTANTSEIRELDSSTYKGKLIEGLKLSFSTSCLSDTTIDSEFLCFIQKQAKEKASAGAVDVVRNIDIMSSIERNYFEEFCDNFCIEQYEDLPLDSSLQENEDPTQKLLEHLLSKPLELKANKTSIESVGVVNTSFYINTLTAVENPSPPVETSRMDSMFSIVPSVLLAQQPKSFTRMSSLNEDEVDNNTLQNLSDTSDKKGKKDGVTLPLDSATKSTRDTYAPPLPPKSSSFRHTRESLKYEFSERRGRSLNLEDDMRSNSPPPLPPRRGGSLIISGTTEMMHRLPPSLMTTRMSAIPGTPNNENTQTLPVFRIPKHPRLLRDRNCISSIIPDNEVPSPIEKNNFSDPNLSSDKIASSDPPELPPRNGHFVPQEHSSSIHVLEHGLHEPPPRPPPFIRSISTRDGWLEKAATFVMTSQDYPLSGAAPYKKTYADQLADKEWIEARNEMIGIEIIASPAASSIPPLDPYTEPPLQHFPVKLDGTHHRLSLISSSSSECHPSLQSHSNGAFRLGEDENLELTNTRSDALSVKQRLLHRQKSSSSSDNDSSKKLISSSRTSSTNTSGRRREKFLTGLKVDGNTTSSINLLSNEAPVPSNASLESRASTFYDLSADNRAFVRDKQDSTATSVSADQQSELSQTSRSRGLAKRLSEVYSVVGLPSRKKEDKKPSKTKEMLPRNWMTRFSFLRDTSVRGVPSDLNTLMDSALSLNELERYNDAHKTKIQSVFSEQEVNRKQRSRSYVGEESLLRRDHIPPESPIRYSAGNANQMMMITNDEMDEASRQEDNNNRNQKNSDRITLALANLKRDMIEYTSVLESLQKTYEEMRSKTPDGIRQRFDLAFKEVKVMHQLQLELNSRIIKDDVDLSIVAEAFKTKDFSTYKRYSILARDLQKEIKSHSSYFSENFQEFSSNIMKPFHRLNTYSQYLQSFLNNYLDETESKLQEAVAYLNNLKQEANTEMNICDMQKCPVELRLAGLISYSGHLHYDGDFLPKQVYVMLFESILVICEDNHDYRVYKLHYRGEQIAEIKEAGDLEIEIKVHPTYQSDTIQLKFKANLASERKTWIERLQSWQEKNRPSFKTIILNTDLQRNIHKKHDRFLPLSLWTLSPLLKETVDAVKHNRIDEKTIKLNKIHNISRPNSGEDAIFNSFMANVEDFVMRLDVLLDQEARAPPQLLGSILRKLRRFYKSVFLPQLRADFEKQPERILVSIVGNLPNFPPLFREYIEVRSCLTLVMEDGLSCNQYISPFKHLSFFIEWLFTLSCIAKYHVKLRGQLAILVNCVEDARVTLLHSAIVNCQLDFYKTGDIVRNGCLESKVKCRAVRGNQDYHVILFEKAILFTRAKIPQYEYVQILWLDQLTFGPQPEHKCSFRLEERGAKKIYVYELKAKNEQQKKQWQSDITKQLHRQVEFVKKNLN